MNANPYSPPNAVITDPVTGIAPGGRPHGVTVAARLLWTAILLGAINGVLMSARTTGASSWLVLVAAAAFILGAEAWLTHKISHGRNWARITFLVVFVLGSPGFIMQLPTLLKRFAQGAAIAVAIAVLQIIALYLVFTGSGARWFRQRRESGEPVA